MSDISAPAALFFGPTQTPLVRAVLKGTKSENTARSYAASIAALDEFAAGRAVTRLLLLDWRRSMDREGKAIATINARLTAVRMLVKEARRAGLISSDVKDSLLDVPNLPNRGTKTGIWLTVEQAKLLLAVPDRSTFRGKRNYCVLAILLGCGLRRDELVRLGIDHLAMSDDRWIFKNIRGKGRRLRSVAIPAWVKEALAQWILASNIRSGRIVRQLSLAPQGLSAGTVMNIVAKAARRIGIADFTPHDLRRTCATLCRRSGALLEDIQVMLGHESLVTTQRYLNSARDFKTAANDSFMGL